MTDIFAGLICRPPRKQYKIDELGPTRYLLHDQMCIRRDLELKNRKKMKIACSHYLPVDSDTFEVEAPVPCVVYLHGNSGSRMDADDLVDFYLEHKISVFSLDFSGCGLSEGEYVTLGHREKEDLHMVLDYLTDLKCISHIGLYGRSMGAATALLVAADDKYYHRIRGMVLDSCYTSVRQVLQELAKKYVGKVPLVPFASMIDSAVDVLREAVIAKVLFGHAADDQLVLAAHTHILFDKYGGEKALNFLQRCFREDPRDRGTPPPPRLPPQKAHGGRECVEASAAPERSSAAGTAPPVAKGAEGKGTFGWGATLGTMGGMAIGGAIMSLMAPWMEERYVYADSE